MVKGQYYVVTELFRLFVIFVEANNCCFGAPFNDSLTRAGELSLFIVGGDVAYPKQFPYTVSLQQLRHQQTFLKTRIPLWHHFCGGTVIAPRYVLTAAHCFANKHLEPAFLSTYRIVAGTIDLSQTLDGQQTKDLERVHLATHDMPSNNPYHMAPRDIALVRLTSALDWTDKVQPMDLPRYEPTEPKEPTRAPSRPSRPPRPRDPSRYPSDDRLRQANSETPQRPSRTARRTAIMSGFGAIKDIKNVGSVKSSLLRFIDVPIIDFQDCVGRLKNQTLNYNNSLDPNDNFCTGSFRTTQEACIGDSGGPLVMMTDDGPVVVGVISFGMRPCGYFKNAPTVYTKVYKYVPWIKNKMWYDDVSWTDYFMVVTRSAFEKCKTWILKCVDNLNMSGSTI